MYGINRSETSCIHIVPCGVAVHKEVCVCIICDARLSEAGSRMHGVEIWAQLASGKRPVKGQGHGGHNTKSRMRSQWLAKGKASSVW
jgi:hypothetical protein